MESKREKYPYSFTLNETVVNDPRPHYHFDLQHRLIVNWGIFSMPKHLFLARTIENIAHYLTLEYFHDSATHITMPYALKAMTVFCATGPYMFTFSIIDTITSVENELTKLKLSPGNMTHKFSYLAQDFTPAMANETVSSIEKRKKVIFSVVNYTIHSHDFHEWGGKFSAATRIKNTNEYYVYRMQHQDLPLLRAYDNTTNVYSFNGLFAHYGKNLVYLMNNEAYLVRHTDLLAALGDGQRQIIHLPIEIMNMYTMSNRSLIMDDLPLMIEARNERYRYFEEPNFTALNYL